jgi:hypothetical protein
MEPDLHGWIFSPAAAHDSPVIFYGRGEPSTPVVAASCAGIPVVLVDEGAGSGSAA